MIYTRYAARTGRIIDVISIPDGDDAFDLHNTLLWTGNADGETHYMLDSEPVERPVQTTTIDETSIAADGESIATLSDVPTGATLAIFGPVTVDPAIIAGGTAQISVDVPGDYTLRVTCFPFLPWESSLHAD